MLAHSLSAAGLRELQRLEDLASSERAAVASPGSAAPSSSPGDANPHAAFGRTRHKVRF